LTELTELRNHANGFLDGRNMRDMEKSYAKSEPLHAPHVTPVKNPFPIIL
jgi:hypothetical protein